MLVEKWSELLEQESSVVAKVAPNRLNAAAIMLENQAQYINEEVTNVTGGVDKWDPILIGLVRRAVPKLIAFDVAGVQPMSGPTGLIFTMKSRYNTQAGAEALFDEADTSHSGTGTHAGSLFGGDDLDGVLGVDGTQLSAGEAYATIVGEQLGTGGANPDFKEMAFNIEKFTVEAKTRGLKSVWSTELEQDMKAVHGLNAEDELMNILTMEITGEINRELLRKMYFIAKLGAQTTTTAGVFDMQQDSDGRWSVEKAKGLLFQIERDRNAIAIQTRRGKGNFIICNGDVASALAMTGLLDNSGNKLDNNLVVDTTGATFAGVILGDVKVYVDPYVNEDFVLVGYKGQSELDAGIYYSPYRAIELTKVINPNSFQPAMGMKTRYGLSTSPMEHGKTTIDATAYRTSPFYRIFKVTNLLG